MRRHSRTPAGVAVLIAVATLSACSPGVATAEPEQTPAGEPAVDQVTEVEPAWSREIASPEGTLSVAVHGDRGYLMAWPGPHSDSDEGELVALDLTTGEDIWAVPHQGVIGDLIADERGGVIVVERADLDFEAGVSVSALTAYDEQGQERWVSLIDPMPDEMSLPSLHDPVAAFDLANDLVMIGSRSMPGIIGLDLNDGNLRWHLQHDSDTGTPLYADTQLDRIGDTLVTVGNFDHPSMALLDLDAEGQVPTVRWHRDPGTTSNDGLIADEHGIVAVTDRYVMAWDPTDGEQVFQVAVDWHDDVPSPYTMANVAGVYLFTDTVIIERDRRWVLDRSDGTVRASYDLDSDDAVPLSSPRGRTNIGAYGPPRNGGHVALGPQGAIARLDAHGSVHALRSDVVDADSTYVPRLLTGDSTAAVGVLRSDESVIDLWAVERSQMVEAGESR